METSPFDPMQGYQLPHVAVAQQPQSSLPTMPHQTVVTQQLDQQVGGDHGPGGESYSYDGHSDLLEHTVDESELVTMDSRTLQVKQPETGALITSYNWELKIEGGLQQLAPVSGKYYWALPFIQVDIHPELMEEWDIYVILKPLQQPSNPESFETRLAPAGGSRSCWSTWRTKKHKMVGVKLTSVGPNFVLMVAIGPTPQHVVWQSQPFILTTKQKSLKRMRDGDTSFEQDTEEKDVTYHGGKKIEKDKVIHGIPHRYCMTCRQHREMSLFWCEKEQAYFFTCSPCLTRRREKRLTSDKKQARAAKRVHTSFLTGLIADTDPSKIPDGVDGNASMEQIGQRCLQLGHAIVQLYSGIDGESERLILTDGQLLVSLVEQSMKDGVLAMRRTMLHGAMKEIHAHLAAYVKGGRPINNTANRALGEKVERQLLENRRKLEEMEREVAKLRALVNSLEERRRHVVKDSRMVDLARDASQLMSILGKRH
eukprot:Colp12_sorted_trinity150504_noHs@5161